MPKRIFWLDRQVKKYGSLKYDYFKIITPVHRVIFSLLTDSLKLISGYFKRKNKSARNLSRKHFEHLYFAFKSVLCEKIFINFTVNKNAKPDKFRYRDYLKPTLKSNTDLFL